MTVRDQELVLFPGWPRGVDQIAREDEIDPQALRLAVNVDITKTGKIRRRPGYKKLLDAASAHSLFALPDGDHVFFADNDELVAVELATMQRRVLATGFASTAHVSFAALPTGIAYTGRTQTGIIRPDLSIARLGLPAPALPATTPGSRAVAVTAVSASGEEGAATPVVSSSGTLVVPATTHPEVVAHRVYVTNETGGALMLYREVDARSPQPLTLPNTLRLGAPAETLDCAPMPPGRILRAFNGRLYVAEGRRLVWSEPLYYGLTNLRKGYLNFPDPIDLLEPVGEVGLVVAAGKRTMFLAGAGPEEFQQRVAHPHGAVPGTGMVVEASVFGVESDQKVVYWWSRAGFPVMMTIDGQVQPLAKDRIAWGDAEEGATLYREFEGVRQMVTSMKEVRPTTGVRFADTMTVSVTRAGEE